MPYERPTLRALARQATADMAAALGIFTILRTSPLAALAKATAGLVNGLYGFLDWIARMAVPVTAEGEFRAAWAALVGIFQKEASVAAGQATFTGTPGSILPEGTLVVRSADGVTFRTTALGTVSSAGIVTVPIEAVEAGAAGNGLSGAEIVIRSAVLGVNAAGAAAGPTTGGADVESDASFQDRMLDRYREPPQGGSEADYERWALEVPGVTRAWVAPNGAGAGTVVVYVMLDDAQAANGGFPQGTDGVASEEGRALPATGDQLAVADFIYPLRPVTALVYIVAPAPWPVDYEIADLEQDTSATRAAIEAALVGMFRRQGEPGGRIYQSDSIAAIGGAEGVTRFTLVSPSGTVQAPPGALPVLGTVTYSS